MKPLVCAPSSFVLRARLDLDEALRTNDRIAFNAGSLTDSIILAMSDYLRIAAPQDCFAFSISAEQRT